MHLFRTLAISFAVSTLRVFASAAPDAGDCAPEGAPCNKKTGPECCPPYDCVFRDMFESDVS